VKTDGDGEAEGKRRDQKKKGKTYKSGHSVEGKKETRASKRGKRTQSLRDETKSKGKRQTAKSMRRKTLVASSPTGASVRNRSDGEKKLLRGERHISA